MCLCVWVYMYMYICNTALEIFGNILLNRITIIIIYYYIDSYRSYQVRITYRITNILSTLISISIFFFFSFNCSTQFINLHLKLFMVFMLEIYIYYIFSIVVFHFFSLFFYYQPTEVAFVQLTVH